MSSRGRRDRLQRARGIAAQLLLGLVGQHGGLVVCALLGSRAIDDAEAGEGAHDDQPNHERADDHLHERVARL